MLPSGSLRSMKQGLSQKPLAAPLLRPRLGLQLHPSRPNPKSANPALPRLSPSDVPNSFGFCGAVAHPPTEKTMRSFSKFVFAALLIAIAAPALAQGTGTSSIAVQQPWARATPAGATTG